MLPPPPVRNAGGSLAARMKVKHDVYQALKAELSATDAHRLRACGQQFRITPSKWVNETPCGIEHLCPVCGPGRTAARLKRFITQTHRYAEEIDHGYLTIHRFILRDRRTTIGENEVEWVAESYRKFTQLGNQIYRQYQHRSQGALRSGVIEDRQRKRSLADQKLQTIGPVVMRLHLLGSKEPYRVDPHVHLSFTTPVRTSNRTVRTWLEQVASQFTVIRVNLPLKLPKIHRKLDSFPVTLFRDSPKKTSALRAHLTYTLRQLRHKEQAEQILRQHHLLESNKIPPSKLLRLMGCPSGIKRSNRPPINPNSPVAEWSPADSCFLFPFGEP